MEEAFERYLVPCNVPKRFFPIDEAIELVHAAGGCAVLAHPMFIDCPTLRRCPHCSRPCSVWGWTVWSAGAAGPSNDTVDRLLTLARRKGLIATGGSDFHQPGVGPNLGSGLGNLRIPYACVEELQERARRYRS